ncbi:MAG TPA: ROK family protein [Chloroflexota bacterium]|nr:ROK family protein [Chloroflexota bacterium]
MKQTSTAPAIALDLGGTRFRVAVGTRKGDLQWRRSDFTRAERGLDPVLGTLYAAVDEAVVSVNGTGPVSGIAIAAPGPLDPNTGVIYDPPNMPGWDMVPLRQLFESRYRTNVHVANDANLAAVGEHRYGAGKGCSQMVYVTVSTGIGGGVIVDNRLLLGFGGFAGEVGHMSVDMNGERCKCGNTGCLEWLASGTSIARRAREMVESGVPTSLSSLTPEEITAKRVTEHATHGDLACRRLIHDVGVALGVGIVNLAHLFNPQKVILGGGVSLNAGPILWDAIRGTVQSRAMESCRRGLEILPAALGDDAGLLGGIAIATGFARA